MPLLGSLINMTTASSTMRGVLNTSQQMAKDIAIRDGIAVPPRELPLLFKLRGVTKVANPNFERFSKQYINSEPELLFTAEYIVDGKNIGVLLAWEKFFDSTHYEIFKKNMFKVDAQFERILFLDSSSLEEETKHYIDYLKNTVGLNIDENKILVILDTVVKDDRIYEYKIQAARVPKVPADVDYDFILESKNLVKQVVVDQLNSSTLFDFAGASLGSRDLAWTIALLNERVSFFGRGAVERALVDLELELNVDEEEFVLLANDLNNIIAVVNDSISLFGIKETINHLVGVLGGLSADFRNAVAESVDETLGVFSYDKYTEIIKGKVPVFSLILQIAQSGNFAAIAELSKLSVALPSNKGTEVFSSIEGITKIVKFINDIYVSLTYSQDNSEKIQEIIDKVKSGAFGINVISEASQSSNVVLQTAIADSTTVTTQGSSAAVAAPTTTTKSTTTTVLRARVL